jgi:6-phosphogluconolactonase
LVTRYLAVAATGLLFTVAARGADYLIYAGAGSGIHGYRFDTRNAKLSPLGRMALLPNPSILVEHPDHRFLYAASDDSAGSVSAFLIDPKSGKLSLVNKSSWKGKRPCELSLDRSGRWLAIAECGGTGSVALLPLRKDGGVGGSQASVQPEGSTEKNGPHATGVLFSPDNRFLLVTDFGLNRIYVYRFNAENGSLTPSGPAYTTVAPGAGVDHLVFHPNGRIVYAVNEARPSVTAYHYDAASGALDEFQTVSTLPPAYIGPEARSTIAVNAVGSMVYASNRGFNSMALLVVDPVRFTLSLLEFTPLIGGTPANFALDPTGAYLLVANRDSNNIGAYTVHPRSGQLRPVGRPTPIDKPECLVFVPVP